MRPHVERAEFDSQRVGGNDMAEDMRSSALFLDRDGIINVDRGYIHRPDQFEFVPGIFQLARFWATELQRPIVVVTNQSGIGRGYFDENAFTELTRWMCDRFEAENAPIARLYHCLTTPCTALASTAGIIHGASPIRG
jgi:D-glycero-D-manno-heptose 1,7-bisphosphate phosphatase